MKVQCIYNNGSNLLEEYLSKSAWFERDSEFRLIVGKEYVVYSVLFNLKDLCYLVHNEQNADFPIWHPAPLFRILDYRPSKYWQFYYNTKYLYGTLAFKEFEEDPYFYENLIDGDKNAVATFVKYKEAMDAEAYLEDEIEMALDWLLRPLAKVDRDNGWYEGSQQEVFTLMNQLKSEITKAAAFYENPEYLNLIKKVETLGVDTGELYGLLCKISERIYAFKDVSIK